MDMFQTLKQTFLTFIRPSSETTDKSIRGIGTKRKREDIEEEEDCQIVYPEKRKKQARASHRWNFDTIFDFLRGRVIKNTEQARNTVMLTGQKLEIKQVERSFLTPTRRSQSVKRTGLRQISNSTILDLTQLNDSDEDDNAEAEKDLELTRVSYDLSINEGESSQCVAIEDDTVNPSAYSTRPLFSKTRTRIKSPRNSPRSFYLTEEVRLKEKQCYKELLAKYTDVRLPEYSESISPLKSSASYAPTTPTIDLTETAHTEDINTTPLFCRKSFQKPFSIDLTREEASPSIRTKPTKKYVDLTYIEPEIEVFEVSPTQKSQQKTKDVSAVLDLDWIIKWKKVLDPVELERQRRINEEERRYEAIKKKQLEEIEKLSKQDNEFPELSLEILNKVKKSLAPGNSKEVFVEGFNAEITRGDIATLRDATWLNDEVVNFYFNLIKNRSESDSNMPKVHVFNTFFYPKIMKTGHSGVKRWTRKVDIFAVDTILIPVHLGMHWCLAVVDMKNKEIAYYDSLKGNNPSCIQALKKYLADESMDKKKTSFDFSGWKETMAKDIPEQMNGCDCGVFMCKYAEYKSRFAKFTFTQKNMPYFRKRMIYEILSKKLM